jgi:hypothetical protein
VSAERDRSCLWPTSGFPVPRGPSADRVVQVSCRVRPAMGYHCPRSQAAIGGAAASNNNVVVGQQMDRYVGGEQWITLPRILIPS